MGEYVLKILLVNVEKDISSESEKFVPLGLGYLSSFAKQKIPSIEIKIITSTDPLAVFKENPDVVGFSSVSQFFGYTMDLINETTRKKIPTLVGGVHMSSLPESLPHGEAIGVVGEGEQTFVELIRLMKQKGCFYHKELGLIKGIVYWDADNRIVRTPSRPPIEPIDTIPMPDRELLNIKKGGTVYLLSSRGCPFKCPFCASTRLYKGVRFFSADYVVNEVQFLIKRYKPILIKFYDDLFVASKSRLRDIVKKMIDTGIHKKALFSINATASMIDEEITKLLKKMNVYTVGIGLESGNEEILQYLKAGKATVEQNERAINILVKNNISPTGSFIIGSPGEDESKFEDTLRFICRSKLSKSYLYLLTPYPGTPLWDYALEKGLVSNDMDWNKLNINQNADLSKRVIVSDCLSDRKLEKLFKKFNFYKRIGYLKGLIIQGLKRPDLILPYVKLHFQKLS